jgi:hypothetical protein
MPIHTPHSVNSTVIRILKVPRIERQLIKPAIKNKDSQWNITTRHV